MDCLFLINPVSGSKSGQRISSLLGNDSSAQGVRKYLVFTDPGRLESQVLSLAPGRDLVVIAGGDGTVSRVVNGLSRLDSPPPFAILPIGTGNDLARTTGWWRIWHNEGLEGFWAAVSAGEVKPIDLWTCDNGPAFIAYAGFGLDARILESVERVRQKGIGRLLGVYGTKFLYAACGARHLLFPTPGCKTRNIELSIPYARNNQHNGNMTGHILLLININHYAGGGRINPTGRWDDGKLEAFILPRTIAYLSLLLKGRLGILSPPDADMQQERMEIFTRQAVPVHFDGEFAGYIPLHRRLGVNQERSLPILVPPGNLWVKEKTTPGLAKETPIKKARSSPVPDPAISSQDTGCR